MPRSESLLLVEDEPLILLCLAERLEDAGYPLDLAANGSAALEKLAKRDSRPSAIITDIRLGAGPNGWDVAREARRLYPDIPVIYMTGDSGADWVTHGVSDSVILQKPVLGDELLATLAVLLEGPTEATRSAANDNSAEGVASWLYVSKSLLLPDSALSELNQIVSLSRKRNAEANVTGGIILAGGRFAQFIEGPAESIGAIRTSIVRDPRHHDIRTLFEGEADPRQFLEWSLAYAGPSRLVERIIQTSEHVGSPTHAALSITRLLKKFGVRI